MKLKDARQFCEDAQLFGTIYRSYATRKAAGECIHKDSASAQFLFAREVLWTLRRKIGHKGVRPVILGLNCNETFSSAANP